MPAKKLINTSRGYLGIGVDVGRTALQSVYRPTVPLTEAALCDWIASALVGQSIEYHEGYLLADRSESHSNLNAKERARLQAVARRAWIACELGLTHLFSHKVADGHYRYIAVRSSCPLNPPEIRNRLRKAASATKPGPTNSQVPH